MNLKQTLIKLERQLRQAGIDQAELDAQILVSFVLSKACEFLFAYPELALSRQQTRRLNRLVKARISGQPLAYITKSRSFYKHDFVVNQSVLIPRPETELMIEAILDKVSEAKLQTLIIDIGTGSGCIVLSLADELKHQSNCHFAASDISRSALRIAKTNAKRLKLLRKISWHQADLLDAWSNKKQLDNLKKFHHIILIANLPYLSSLNWRQTLSPRQCLELEHEPGRALFAGNDGFDLYRRLAQQLKALKDSLGATTFELYAEIDPSQLELFKTEFSYLKQLQIKADLNHHARLVIAT